MALESLIEKTGLEIHSRDSYDGGTVYLGRSFSTIKDEETGKQFKESVEKVVEKLTGKKLACEEIEGAWYNG